MTVHGGGCICRALRYETRGDPLRVTVCHCRWCQRATGSAYMVEPLFRGEDLRVTEGSTATYHHRSEGSDKLVHVHFCATCGTKLFLTFERFPGICGVYAGTFDDPDWIAVRPDNAKHIFIEAARHETILPPSIPAFAEHAIGNDGTPREPVVFGGGHVVGRRGTT